MFIAPSDIKYNPQINPKNFEEGVLKIRPDDTPNQRLTAEILLSQKPWQPDHNKDIIFSGCTLVLILLCFILFKYRKTIKELFIDKLKKFYIKNTEFIWICIGFYAVAILCAAGRYNRKFFYGLWVEFCKSILWILGIVISCLIVDFIRNKKK